MKGNKRVINIGSDKYVDYQKLDAFESVSIAFVLTLAVTAGVMICSAWFVQIQKTTL